MSQPAELIPSSSPTAAEILADAATSDWLKAALRTALKRDPVDALNDALLLSIALEAHLREVLDLEP